jgi:hypothetical protein
MKQIDFWGRRAARIENGELRLTVTEQGGHVAELLHKNTQISPLWIPHWPSIEPADYSPARHPEYGEGSEAQLLSGIFGHSICLDLFGGPDEDEVAAGIPVHGEASVASYQVSGHEGSLTFQAELPKAQMTFSRTIDLAAEGVIAFSETIENHCCTGRPIGWTQHVTLGAPFLEGGQTRFQASATHSRVFEGAFNDGLGMQVDGAEFEWPHCPRKDGGVENLSTLTGETVSGGFTAHLMDPRQDHAFFVAWSPRYQLAFGYVWRREDFPWLSRWEENHLRRAAPWNSAEFALGLEFGVSPMAESRRRMVERGKMFSTPTFFWAAAQGRSTVHYCAFLRHSATLPNRVQWDGERAVVLC